MSHDPHPARPGRHHVAGLWLVSFTGAEIQLLLLGAPAHWRGLGRGETDTSAVPRSVW